uniref:Uncharacterized protein n=1 Tax=Rhizophora mucronata TaxID=61149 RepID=A0A2P2QBA1_RHIMU
MPAKRVSLCTWEVPINSDANTIGIDCNLVFKGLITIV